MGKRRKRGEGSWGKKKIKGTIYFYFRDSSGRYTYGKTERAVKEKLAKQKEEEPLTANNALLLGDYLKKWLDTIRTQLDYSTYTLYDTTIRVRIIGFKKYYNIADKRLSELTPAMVQKYLDIMAGYYSVSTIRKSWSIIRRAITYAEIRKDIKPLYLSELCHIPSEKNVAHPKLEIFVPDKDECERIYEACNKLTSRGTRRYGNVSYVIILIMNTGLRVSEIGGLKWSNVDLENREIHINQILLRVDGEMVDKNRTKTESGARVIPLSDRAVESIKYFENIPHTEDDYVCVTSNGRPYDRSQIEHGLKRIINHSECKCKEYTPHGLRHGFGSVLLSEGVDIKIVSELLGHSNVMFTYNTYIKIFKQDKVKAIETLNNL